MQELTAYWSYNGLTAGTSNNCRIFAADPISPDGGIGRRVGLKHQWTKVRAGSIPALGTMKLSPLWSTGHSGDSSFYLSAYAAFCHLKREENPLLFV